MSIRDDETDSSSSRNSSLISQEIANHVIKIRDKLCEQCLDIYPAGFSLVGEVPQAPWTSPDFSVNELGDSSRHSKK